MITSDDLVVAKLGCEQHMTLGIMGNGVHQCMHISEFSKRYFPRTSSILLTQAAYEVRTVQTMVILSDAPHLQLAV